MWKEEAPFDLSLEDGESRSHPATRKSDWALDSTAFAMCMGEPTLGTSRADASYDV